MIIKVQILTKCEHCSGQAMLPIGEEEDIVGRKYIRYGACPNCQGSGKQTRWITVAEFAEMLNTAKCEHEHVSRRGGFHFSAGEVWDDIEEVCDDCGTVLD